MMALHSFHRLGTTHPATQCRITEDVKPLKHRSEIVKYRTNSILLRKCIIVKELNETNFWFHWQNCSAYIRKMPVVNTRTLNLLFLNYEAISNTSGHSIPITSVNQKQGYETCVLSQQLRMTCRKPDTES